MQIVAFVLVIWMADGSIDFSGKFTSKDECMEWGRWKIAALSKWPDKKVLGWQCEEEGSMPDGGVLNRLEFDTEDERPAALRYIRSQRDRWWQNAPHYSGDWLVIE